MIATTYPAEALKEQADARCAALRSELQATQAAFHARLASVSPSDWRQPSPSSAWTFGEVLVHLTWALEYLPEEVRRARQGRGMFNMNKRLSDTVSFWYVRWLARTATPASLGRRYDAAMAEAIKLLAVIEPHEWSRGADFYGEGFHSVEALFHTPAHHLAEHTAGWRSA